MLHAAFRGSRQYWGVSSDYMRHDTAGCVFHTYMGDKRGGCLESLNVLKLLIFSHPDVVPQRCDTTSCVIYPVTRYCDGAKPYHTLLYHYEHRRSSDTGGVVALPLVNNKATATATRTTVTMTTTTTITNSIRLTDQKPTTACWNLTPDRLLLLHCCCCWRTAAQLAF